jgi:hypothetical protein
VGSLNYGMAQPIAVLTNLSWRSNVDFQNFSFFLSFCEDYDQLNKNLTLLPVFYSKPTKAYKDMKLSILANMYGSQGC